MFELINKYDKNGRKLKGATKIMREMKEAGGQKGYDKKIAMVAAERLFDTFPEIPQIIANEERKKAFKVVK